ncbi:KxYKxGKxW signal peptide domain-containing protein [Lactiplantibacillus plantarum]|nr:KxYKxGKxW signal peptide domain-containing protein [Lactiplantibacillus plantarum]MBS0945712.1 KxYKxGKxW signal peptide domain-containing protein [Lactiplantibacillus plantarum]
MKFLRHKSFRGDPQVHYKMFKVGRTWVFTAMAAFVLTAAPQLVSHADTVSADTSSDTASSTSTSTTSDSSTASSSSETARTVIPNLHRIVQAAMTVLQTQVLRAKQVRLMRQVHQVLVVAVFQRLVRAHPAQFQVVVRARQALLHRA